MMTATYLPELSSKKTTFLMIVGENQLQVISILFEPPEIECEFEGIEFEDQSTLTLLAVINTTHCESMSKE